VMSQFGASLTEDGRSVIYNCNMFIIQATRAAVAANSTSITLSIILYCFQASYHGLLKRMLSSTLWLLVNKYIFDQIC
jgi:hypothetical protein